MVGTHTLTGRTVGHYLVLEPVGEGGMGVVYKARDTRLGRLAALKVMRPTGPVTPTGRRRFVREAQTASALNHPNILTIYEIDADGGLDYIAMEYVEGGTLADVMSAPDRSRPSGRCGWRHRSPTRSRPRTPRPSCIAISSRRTS